MEDEVLETQVRAGEEGVLFSCPILPPGIRGGGSMDDGVAGTSCYHPGHTIGNHWLTGHVIDNHWFTGHMHWLG